MKLKVAVIFGGKSAEHEVSLRSATNIFNAVDRARLIPLLIGVDKDLITELITLSLLRDNRDSELLTEG